MRRLTACSMVLVAAVAVASAAVLELEVVDGDGSILPSRVLVRPRGGACVVPEGVVELKIGPDRWFMSPGKSRLEVPAGRVELRVERGLEYVRHKEDLKIAEPQQRVRIVLERWVNMGREGYRCGENHIHVEASKLGPMLVAEGLDYGTSLTWWNGPDRRRPVPKGDGPTRRLAFAGNRLEASVHDAELEYGWGAAYLLGLPEALPLKSDRGRPNLDYVAHARRSGGLVCYQGGWSREVGLDALLGHVHVVNVCNNNFHLHKFQPRSRYSNLLGVKGFPVYADTDQGMMQMNTDTYYRLLNWGLRLAAGAGSACGVKQNPVGYNRAYVRAKTGATLDEFHGAWAAGRNFVTNGPMLLLATRKGHRPGDVVVLPKEGGTVRVGLTACSDSKQPLTSIEIIVNGQVAHSFKPDKPNWFRGELNLAITRGSWVAARCTARDDHLSDAELAVYARGADNAPMRQRPSRLRYAHTSPIYVTVGGSRTAVRSSVEEGLQMLDCLEAFARRTAHAQYLPPTLKAIGTAREKLRFLTAK